MSVTVTDKGGDFEIPEEGQYLAVVADVVDLGPVATNFGVKERVQITWLLDAFDSEGNQFRIAEFFNKSLHEKASLRKRIKSITGVDPTGTFDMETMLGTNSLIVIEHNEGDKRTYANVVAVLKAPKGRRLEVPADFERRIDKDGVGSTEKPVNTAASAKANQKKGRAAQDEQPAAQQPVQQARATQAARPSVAVTNAAPAPPITDEDLPF